MTRTLGILALAITSACGADSGLRARTWPTGTAVVVGGEALGLAEIDRVADALATLKPSYTTPMLRRQALTHVLFPRAAGRVGRASEMDAAREAADAWRTGGEGAAIPRERRGDWNELGLDLWLGVRDLELGTWSPVSEGAGLFFAARVLEREGGPPAVREEFRLEVVEFPWMDECEGLPLAVFTLSLEIVDPAFRAIVPERWKYPMEGARE